MKAAWPAAPPRGLAFGDAPASTHIVVFTDARNGDTRGDFFAARAWESGILRIRHVEENSV
jgi:hypothetical protein